MKSRVEPKEPSDGDQCLTPEEVALMLRTTLRTLARWRAGRTGPAFLKLHDGRSSPVRYPIRELRQWLHDRTRTTGGSER